MKYTCHGFVPLLLLLLGFGGTRIANAQKIFNASPSAKPGEAINLQGDFGAGATAFMTKGTSTTSISLPVRVQSAGQATVELPTSLTLDLYKVWVQDQGLTSPVVYVNRARGMHFDSPEITPGGSLRIFGRNLQLNGGTAQVRFSPLNTGSTGVQGTINTAQSDAYKLSVTVPASLVPGTTYDVFVTNGFGGTAGETKVEQPITVIATGTDYFNLGVPWATKFSFYSNVYNVKTDTRLSVNALGNGTNNDQPAIQDAIDKASAAGGGIVYLPAGTYKLLISGISGLELRSNVVVQGAGKTQTFVKYGYGAAQTFGYGIAFAGSQKMGLSDLSLENVNEQGQWYHNLIVYGATTDVFLNNVNYLYGGESLVFGNSCNRLLIKGCSLTSRYRSALGGLNQGPLTVFNATNVILRNNMILHEVGQTGFNDWDSNLLFEGNTFTRDAAIGQGPNPVDMDTRTLSINFAKNVAILNNNYETINGPAYYHVDGETILSEGGGPNRKDAYFGNVTSATSTSLSSTSANWGSLTSDAIVVIIYGKGMGQWRRITSNSTTTLNLANAWDVTPDATSRYSITDWSAQNWLVQGNTMLNNRAGLELYAASGNDLAFVGNTLTNNDGILLRTAHSMMGSAQVFNMIYNTQVVGNTVQHTASSPYQYIPAYIGVLALQTEPVTLGTHTIGVEIRNNSVIGLNGYVPKSGQPYPNNNTLNTEGYYSYFLPEFFDPNVFPHVFGNNGDTPITLGTIFQNNQATNLTSAIYVNSGAYNTLVCNTSLTNVGNLGSDTYAGNSTHTSVRTVICPGATSALKARFYPRANNASRMTNGKFQGSNDNSTWTDLGTITTQPANAAWTELPIGTTLYRYFRYLSPANSYGNIAELEFYSSAVKISGTGFGTAGAYNNGTTTFDKALDGNINTAFDASVGSGAYVGIDRGATPLRLPENPASTVAGLNYKYYEGSWTQLPNFSALTPVTTGTTTALDLTKRQQDGNYALQFTGYITVPTDGQYTFYTNSDDGSKLYIGSTQVVDNDGSHAVQEHSGTIGLQAGTHAFTVTYYQGGGGQELTVSYQGPGVGETIANRSVKRSVRSIGNADRPAAP